MERNSPFKEERKIMDNALFTAVLSLGVTLLTSLFKTANLSKKQKSSIAAGLSVVAGAASVAMTSGDYSPANLAANMVAIFGASQAMYTFVLNGTGLNTKLSDVRLFGSNQIVVEALAKQVEEVAKEAVKAAEKKTPVKTPAKKAATVKKATVKKPTE